MHLHNSLTFPLRLRSCFIGVVFVLPYAFQQSIKNFLKISFQTFSEKRKLSPLVFGKNCIPFPRFPPFIPQRKKTLSLLCVHSLFAHKGISRSDVFHWNFLKIYCICVTLWVLFVNEAAAKLHLHSIPAINNFTHARNYINNPLQPGWCWCIPHTILIPVFSHSFYFFLHCTNFLFLSFTASYSFSE